MMARSKASDDVFVSLSTRIKLDTMQRVDAYCQNTGAVKGTLIDQAINEFLDKLEMTN